MDSTESGSPARAQHRMTADSGARMTDMEAGGLVDDQVAASSADADPTHSTLEFIGPDHSTLEVAPPDHSTLEVTPYVDYDKEATQQPYNDQSGAAWEGDAGAAKRARILGLKRRTFFIVLWAALLAIAIAVGVGVGVGVGVTGQSRSISTDTEPAADASTSATTTILPSSQPTQTPPPSTGASSSTATDLIRSSTFTSQISTGRSSGTSSAPQSTASLQIGGPGGRCSNNWGGDCICLDEGICRSVWQGTPQAGTPDNWPCPNDLDNIMACIVRPCLGQVAPAQCLWSEACRELNPGNGSAPNCPGGNDFVCCAHSWNEQIASEP
jgi:hypothetical protein